MNNLDEATKNARRDHLMAVQQKIALEFNQKQLGKTIDVILDAPVAEQPGAWVGRSSFDAPDVDGCVFVTESEHALSGGQIVPVEIVHSQAYDLIGVAVGEPK